MTQDELMHLAIEEAKRPIYDTLSIEDQRAMAFIKGAVLGGNVVASDVHGFIAMERAKR